MRRVVFIAVLAALSACGSFGAQTIRGDENQVVLSSPDQQKAQQHCASFGKDAINLGQNAEGQITYACRPRRT
jgi:hypothetical protein